MSAKQRKDLPLKLINLNCQSLINKKASLSTLCETTDADIIIGTESWLTDGHFSSEIFPPGYKVFRKDRKKGKGGGVFIITKGTILAT